MSEKTYLKCSAKAKTFRDGGSVILIGAKAADLIAFAQQHANDRGYVNLKVQQRREPGQYGDTHSVMLDDYQPKAKDDEGGPW
jgi:hypothetical protein